MVVATSLQDATNSVTERITQAKNDMLAKLSNSARQNIAIPLVGIATGLGGVEIFRTIIEEARR